MKRISSLFLSLLVVFALSLQSNGAPPVVPVAPVAPKALPVPHYLDPATIDAKTLLPSPPADGSPEALKEIDLIVEKQNARTPADVARAKAEMKVDAFTFTDVVGPWFAPKGVQDTAVFFRKVNEDVGTVSNSAKKIWKRPRPYVDDLRIQPMVDLDLSSSYPSDHATRGMVFALILSELLPDKKDAILARGTQIGDDRVMAGVEYPSDVTAGQTLAKAIFDKLKTIPAFKDDLADAKSEMAAAQKK